MIRQPAAAWVLGVLAVFLIGLDVAGAAAEEQTADPDGANKSASIAESAPEVIPVSKIALGATEVATLLGTFAADFVPDREIEAIRKALPAASADLGLRLQRTLDMLKEQPPLETLQIEGQLWQQRQLQLSGWLNLLTDRATLLQEDLTRLRGLHATWTRTRDAEQTASAPAPIKEQISATVAAIEAPQPLNRAQLDQALDLQGKIAQEVVRCEGIRAQVTQLQQGAVGGLFARDTRLVWSPELWTEAYRALPARLPEIAASYWADMRLYVRDPSKRMPLHLTLFILACAALLAARRQVDQWVAEGKNVSRVTAVFDHPFAAALLLVLMAATTLFSPTPFGVKQIFSALALAPMIILARPMAHPTLLPVLYTLGALFALDTLRHAFAGVPPLVGQLIILLESLAGSLVLLRVLLDGRLRHGRGEQAGSGWQTFWRFAGGLILVGLVIGGLASIFGYMRLARLTTPAILVGGADLLWLYAVVEVACAVISYALRVWPLRGLRMVQHHRDRLETRVYRLLVWVAVVAWCARYLDYLGLWDPTLAFASGLLDTRFEMGSFSSSPGDVLAFVATLVVAYLLSAAIRFVLEEEIYPRTGVATGISYAASSVFHYAILTIAFLVALGFLGVTLTQVTVLAGALGVGIGFGLQGVVNNFVSGLILLFERPINLGDAVEVGDLQCWVRRIGIRASVVRTVQGAEIIVPNAQLTSQQVTNWTLSDQVRRIDLPVGVSYGSAPKRVIELLEGVARAHPKVLRNPPPCCLFMSYGDSSINFELRAWTEFASWIQVQSDLTVAMYEAVYAAGLSFPFPQREVRLLSEPAKGFTPAGSDSLKAGK